MADPFVSDRFPRASKYHPDWLMASVSGGANSLFLAEWLAEKLELQPGMRILDLGCGRGASSIFFHREFGVQVWATDLWLNPTERYKRIQDAGVDQGVFPIQADARNLPYAEEFFDAIVSIDSYFYYGTDDQYLGYLARFVKPGGSIAMAGAAFLKEIGQPLPTHLKDWWTPDLICLHSAPWWRAHWERTGIVDVLVADELENGWRHWLEWLKAIAPGNAPEIAALEADQGEYFGYIRMVGRRRPGVQLPESITSVPVEYVAAPLLRSGAK